MITINNNKYQNLQYLEQPNNELSIQPKIKKQISNGRIGKRRSTEQSHKIKKKPQNTKAHTLRIQET